MKKTTIEIITSLFILLWVYAALSKLLDYETFKVQLGKSPLLTDFAGFAAIAVPVSELLIAGMLLLKRFRLLGLYASLFMMVMFTAYIIAILNFSYYIPCSCGGILSSLGWTEHIIFNLVFVGLAIVGIIFSVAGQRQTNATRGSTIKTHPVPGV
ncbi:MauE/DoxX family redox-associated membrane protein [Parapedobacter sp. 10938]|uniref:MauE/DoxX family redox-associated membrane protein n=1 Tax=Parapedobacter flavus TaxID=3110225 RepID=UPI002DBDEAF5|nr:MauE/DoxX family redox-associated membrane protein [Parapedobacter sp. 10938]MEC3880210.1 MauE/DoxX family redox-associated membrane protein [Parapedobacter sp. 10938]